MSERAAALWAGLWRDLEARLRGLVDRAVVVSDSGGVVTATPVGAGASQTYARLTAGPALAAGADVLVLRTPGMGGIVLGELGAAAASNALAIKDDGVQEIAAATALNILAPLTSAPNGSIPTQADIGFDSTGYARLADTQTFTGANTFTGNVNLGDAAADSHQIFGEMRYRTQGAAVAVGAGAGGGSVGSLMGLNGGNLTVTTGPTASSQAAGATLFTITWDRARSSGNYQVLWSANDVNMATAISQGLIYLDDAGKTATSVTWKINGPLLNNTTYRMGIFATTLG